MIREQIKNLQQRIAELESIKEDVEKELDKTD